MQYREKTHRPWQNGFELYGVDFLSEVPSHVRHKTTVFQVQSWLEAERPKNPQWRLKLVLGSPGFGTRPSQCDCYVVLGGAPIVRDVPVEILASGRKNEASSFRGKNCLETQGQRGLDR